MLRNCLRKIFLTSLLLVAIFMQQAIAQNDARSGSGIHGITLDHFARPIAGVTVSVKGTSVKTTTNEAGEFNLNTTASATLVFEHPLFDVRELKVRRGEDVSVRLAERYLRVLNGVDTSVIENKNLRKTELLYEAKSHDKIISSVGSVYTNQLKTTPSSLYLGSLQGRLAGLNITQTRGFYQALTSPLTDVDIFVGNIPKNNSGTGPTDNTEYSVQLRGHGGSAGQGPVTIVDGVQRDIYSLDPQNIESISVLRDALSTILLGQNSSRGVLLVTTKTPQIGAPHISFTAETGTQSSLGLPTPLSAYQYAYLVNEALLNEGRNAAYTAADFNAYRDGSDPIGHPDVNWYNTIIRKNPLLTRYNLNVDGGGTRARYIISLSYLNQDGFFKTDASSPYNTNLQLRRYLMNSKIDVDVNKDFNIGLQLFGRLQQGNQPGAGAQNILNALLTTPNNAYPVRNPNGSYGGNSNYRSNLMAMVEGSGYMNDNANDVMANLDLTYRFDKWVKGLYFKGRGNVSVQSASLIDRSKGQPVFFPAISGSDTVYNRFGDVKNQVNNFTSTSWARYTFAQLSLGYDKSFGDHTIQALTLFDKKTTLLNYDIPSRLTNIAGKVSYDYKGKYMAEAALNYSGYDRYRPGHQFGLFYAGGLGWNIAKEDFIRDIRWINEMKLRVTYGRTGNANIDNYGYYVYRSYFADVAGVYPMGNTYSPNAGGLSENGQPNSQTLANLNATWEKANKLNIGLDLSLFNNHFQLTGDYYYERYFDVLQTRGRSIQLIGQNYPAENIGINSFSGVELTATYQNNAGNFNYFVTGNASLQDSKVIFMDEMYQPNSWNRVTGQRVGQMFGLIADGFIQTYQETLTTPTISGYTLKVGDFKYKDLNGDGVIDMFDAAPIGKQKPLIYYGLTVGFSYKGFAVSALLQGVRNRDIVASNGYLDAGFQNQNNGFSQAYVQSLNRWIPEAAATATYPRLTPGGNGYNYSPAFYTNSAFVHDGDYFRLKNINVEYSVPYNWIRGLKLAGVKFFFNAQNLFTWAAYDIRDPESVLPNYPLQKVLNFGINIKL